MQYPFRSDTTLDWTVKICSTLTIIIGAAIFIFQWLDIPSQQADCLDCSLKLKVSAICFILLGVGLFLLHFNFVRLSGALGSIVILIAFATILEYFIENSPSASLQNTTRFLSLMAIHRDTAFNFLLAGSSLVIGMRMRKRKISPLFLGLLASIIVAFSSLLIFGNLIGFKRAETSSPIPIASLIISLLFVTHGIGVFAYAWKVDRTPRATIKRWVPIVIGVGFMTAVLYLWQALSTLEQVQIQRTIQADTVSVKNEIYSRMLSQIHSIERMAKRWSAQGKIRKAVWEKDIGQYIRHYPGLRAVQWIDPHYIVRWIEPYRGNENIQSLNLSEDPVLYDVLDLAYARNRPYVTPFYNLNRGGSGFQIFAPIIHQDEFNGFIGGTFSVKKLLDDTLRNVALNYSIILYDNDTIIYRRDGYEETHRDKWSYNIILRFGPQEWHLSIWPTSEWLRETRSLLPSVVLIVGIFTSGLLALAVYLAQTSRLRARELEMTNIELSHEVRERKRAEDEIRKMSIALENALDGISRLDPHGRFISVNKSFAGMLSYAPEELVGLEWEKTIHPDARKKVKLAHRNMIASGKSEVEVKTLRKDGSSFDAQLEFIKGTDSRNQFSGFYCFMQDITERKYRETLEIKSEFISMVSHELRTPLQAMKEGIGIVADQTAGMINEDQRSFLQIALRNLERLSRLIHDVLDFQRLEAGAMEYIKEWVQIDEILDHVKNVMLPLAESKKLALHISCAKNLPHVFIDPDRIIQVLINLINNSIKFTDSGHVTIAAEICENNSLLLSVKDTGIGIREHDLPKLFKTFSQIDSGKFQRRQGTGLGLAISKRIVEQHGGSIWAESKIGAGSIFKFSLPTAKEIASSTTARKQSLNI